MKEGMDLPPALTIVTQAVMAMLFGFIGLMVAVPLLAVVIVPIKLLYIEGVVGVAAVDEDIPGINGNAALPLPPAPAAGNAEDG
jgi:predicted PurR-regulated permease PerM